MVVLCAVWLCMINSICFTVLHGAISVRWYYSINLEETIKLLYLYVDCLRKRYFIGG